MRMGKLGTTRAARVEEEGTADEEEEDEEEAFEVARDAASPLLVFLEADDNDEEKGKAWFRKARRKRSIRKGLANTKAFGTQEYTRMEKSRARSRHTHTVHIMTAIVSAPKGSAAHSPSQSLSIIWVWEAGRVLVSCLGV